MHFIFLSPFNTALVRGHLRPLNKFDPSYHEKNLSVSVVVVVVVLIFFPPHIIFEQLWVNVPVCVRGRLPELLREGKVHGPRARGLGI